MKRLLIVFFAVLLSAATTGCKGDNSLEHFEISTDPISEFGSIASISETDLKLTSVTADLSTTENTEIYKDDSWRDVKLILINTEGNVGSIIFTISAVNPGGQVDLLYESNEVGIGLALTSGYIASSYTEFIVTAKATSVDGSYKISYGLT